MSYDPTEWTPQPSQQPASGQSPTPQPGQSNPVLRPYEQNAVPPTQAAVPPAYGQSNPGQPAYGQPAVPPTPAYGQSNPGQPAYGQPAAPPTPAYGQSNPGQPAYGQPAVPPTPAYGQSNPGQPAYGQPAVPPTPAYGQSNPGQPAYDPNAVIPTQAAFPSTAYGQPAVPPAPPPPAYGQSSPGLPPYGQPAVPPDPPAFGQSSPGLPPYSQPTQSNPYAGQPTYDPYGVPVTPGTYQPGYQQPVQPKKKGPRPLLVVIIIVVLVALLGGGGAFFYISTRPKPVITTVTSTYHAGANVAGANTTTMTLKGTDFSGNSTVTIYLDNYTTIAPGSQPVQSDSNGNITATLTVTSDWSVGNHTLLAKDASGYQTKVGWPITIVTPGQDNTPGPNGAPPDDANMTITVSVQSSNDSAPESNTLIVTGSANGGTVCGKDDGTPQTDSGTLDNGDQYTETIILSCSGTYKGGKLTYTETATSYKLTDDTDGASCSAATPFVVAQMAGTFSSATDISGTYSSDATTLTCSLDGQSESEPIDASTGTWTGTALVN